jgi:putative ABC transport system substrate-binding protein
VKRRECISLLGGAAAGWPLAAHAQQMRSPYRIGFLGLLAGENTSTFMKSFLERLNELGYREGYNMIFDYRSAEGVPERLPQLAADAVRASPDVLVTGMGTLVAKAAKAATSTIPIVFTGVADPPRCGIGYKPWPTRRQRHRDERPGERHCRQAAANPAGVRPTR